MEAVGKYTQEIWNGAAPVFEKIKAHPFVCGLADGTLPRESFAHYLSQDILYLKDDNRALHMLAERAPNKADREFFLQLETDGLDIEHALHNEYLNWFNVKEAEKKSPVINIYTSFLLKNAKSAPYEVAVAALLPCFWIYNKTGNFILSRAKSENPYKKWIDTYRGDEYENYTFRFVGISERLAEKASGDVFRQMVRIFKMGSIYELDFFQESSSIVCKANVNCM